MAQKRMFSLAVVDTDKFLDMSSSAQALYFHLGMHGDDDGFVSSPKKIARVAGCNDDDLRLLAAKGFVIPFDSGVVVITDWRIHNTLKNDRYHETVYQEEKAKIDMLPNGKYALSSNAVPECIQDGSGVESEHNVTQPNVTKPSKEGTDKPSTRFCPPSVEAVKAYCDEKGYHIDAEQFVAFYEAKGWYIGKNKMKNWKQALVTWEKRGESHGNIQQRTIGQRPGDNRDWTAGFHAPDT